MDTQDYVKGLRAIAAWYEGHPNTPIPYGPNIEVFGVETKALPDLIRALGGVDKEYMGSYLWLSHTFPGGLKLRFYVPREAVCTRRQTGTKWVPEYYQPAREEPVYEWDCKPILSGDGD